MIVLDTCALVFGALSPERLTRTVRKEMDAAGDAGDLAVSDISLWEVAMLVSHRRLDPGTDVLSFLRLALAARPAEVLPITPEIASRAASLDLHGDPADRIIVATAIEHRASLVTTDGRIISSGLVGTLR